MSLKRYLFLLIGLFVLTLAGSQLLFINYIQQQMDQEVAYKSQALSKQALRVLTTRIEPELTVDQYAQPALKNKPQIKIEIIETPNKVVPLGHGVNFVSGDQTKTILVKNLNVAPKPQLGKLLEEELADLHFRKMDKSAAFTVSRKRPDHQVQHIVQFDQKTSAIGQYFHWLIVGTIMLTLLGLILAYGLAKYISRPLGELSRGFNRLQQGQLGTQVEAKGIQEVQATLTSFNQMSSRLLELNKIEGQFHNQQQMADLGEIARGLAHTLRNPINTIGLAVEQIGQGKLTSQESQALTKQVRHKISHIDNTIKSLLTLTSSDLDRTEQVNLNQVIEDVMLEVSMHSPHQIVFSPQCKVFIKGAQVEIRAMIHTLIINAIEASQPLQPITIRLTQINNQKCIVVSDQGSGLAPSVKDKLFKPHVSSKSEGAGMGLYIAQRICQSYYQGKVQLTDNQPQGCVATLTLNDHKIQSLLDE